MQETKQVNTLCALCENKLKKTQKKYCSQKCRITSLKSNYTKVYIPDVLLAKPTKEKIYKQKVFRKINKKYAPKKIKQNREEMKNMWKWYWDVRFKQEPLDKNMSSVWKYYDYLLKNEKYQSTR